MMFSITGTVRAPNERSNELLKPCTGHKVREREKEKMVWKREREREWENEGERERGRLRSS